MTTTAQYLFIEISRTIVHKDNSEQCYYLELGRCQSQFYQQMTRNSYFVYPLLRGVHL